MIKKNGNFGQCISIHDIKDSIDCWHRYFFALHLYYTGLQKILYGLNISYVSFGCLNLMEENKVQTFSGLLAIDAYCKISTIALLILFNLISCCTKNILAILEGATVILSIFYSMNLIWIFVEIMLYSQDQMLEKMQKNCPREISTYVLVTFILGSILSIINLVLLWLRPSQE